MPYNQDPTRYVFTTPDVPEVLYAGGEFDSALSGLLQFSALALSSAIGLQRLPPAFATQAVRQMMEEKKILESHFAELSSYDKARAKSRINLINDVVYLATSTEPAQLNAAQSAKLIADYMYTRHSAHQLREKLNAHTSGFMTVRNPSGPSGSSAVDVAMLAESARQVDAADLLLKAARAKRVSKRTLAKLERTLLDADLAHVKLKLAFLEQAKRRVAGVADKALSIVQTPELSQEIQGLIENLPETAIAREDAKRLSTDIENAARQDLLRRLAENDSVPGKVTLTEEAKMNTGDTSVAASRMGKIIFGSIALFGAFLWLRSERP
jgi:hypothetical protein